MVNSIRIKDIRSKILQVEPTLRISAATEISRSFLKVMGLKKFSPTITCDEEFIYITWANGSGKIFLGYPLNNLFLKQLLINKDFKV